MADSLITLETINQDQIGDIMDGKPPRPPVDTVSVSQTEEPSVDEDGSEGVGDAASQH
jgi:hypothetical protein